MLDLSDIPPPASEALILYVELQEKDVHFFDSALKVFNNMVNPRRDVQLLNGKVYYKNYIAPECWPEVQQIVDALRDYISIGDCFIES
jgi:hypothetical protein